MSEIGNVIDPLPRPFNVSTLTHLSNNNGNQANDIQHFYDRERSYITENTIEGSITKTSIQKLRLHHREY